MAIIRQTYSGPVCRKDESGNPDLKGYAKQLYLTNPPPTTDESLNEWYPVRQSDGLVFCTEFNAPDIGPQEEDCNWFKNLEVINGAALGLPERVGAELLGPLPDYQIWPSGDRFEGLFGNPKFPDCVPVTLDTPWKGGNHIVSLNFQWNGFDNFGYVNTTSGVRLDYNVYNAVWALDFFGLFLNVVSPPPAYVYAATPSMPSPVGNYNGAIWDTVTGAIYVNGARVYIN